MDNLKYINELGIGQDQTNSNTEASENESTKSEKDLSLEPDAISEPTENNDTEQKFSNVELDALKKQIAGMEKRIADKDAYIQELREAQKNNKEVVKEEKPQEEEEDFWSNPDEAVKGLKKQLKEQADYMRVQDLRIQETVYASTVKDYWTTVNQESLKEAVLNDTDFANDFNKSKEPYKTAYEYLKTKAERKTESDKSLKEQIRQEILKEMNIKHGREVPPIISGGSSNTSSRDISSDGFAAVFGSY